MLNIQEKIYKGIISNLEVASDDAEKRNILGYMKSQGVISRFDITKNKVRVQPTARMEWIEKDGAGPWILRDINTERFIFDLSAL